MGLKLENNCKRNHSNTSQNMVDLIDNKITILQRNIIMIPHDDALWYPIFLFYLKIQKRSYMLQRDFFVKQNIYIILKKLNRVFQKGILLLLLLQIYSKQCNNEVENYIEGDVCFPKKWGNDIPNVCVQEAMQQWSGVFFSSCGLYSCEIGR